jgi:hypothetical protein
MLGKHSTTELHPHKFPIFPIFLSYGFRNMFSNFHVSGDFPIIFMLLVSSLIPLLLESTL